MEENTDSAGKQLVGFTSKQSEAQIGRPSAPVLTKSSLDSKKQTNSPGDKLSGSQTPRESQQAKHSEVSSKKPSLDILLKLAEFGLRKDVSRTDNESEDEGEDEEEGEFEEKKEEVDPRKNLNKDQLTHFREMFDLFDPERKEKIATKNICIVLRLMGLNPTKAELKQHMREIDPNNRGTIDFYSFLLPICQRIHEVPESHEDIIEAFRVFDEEDKGYVETDKMYEFLTSLGEDLEDFEIELFLKMTDPKNTGKIYYQKFVEKMMGIKTKKAKAKPKKGGKKGGKKAKKKK